MIPDIVPTDRPSAADREVILQGLVQFNDAAVGPSGFRPFALLVKHPTSGETLGGMTAMSFHGWMFVELLWLPEPLRGGGLGARLMCALEAEAVARGCCGIWLDTYSFQARGFYEKLGFRLFGTLDNAPPGHQRFYLEKRLDAARGRL